MERNDRFVKVGDYLNTSYMRVKSTNSAVSALNYNSSFSYLILQEYIKSATKFSMKILGNSDGKFDLRLKFRPKHAHQESARRILYPKGLRRLPTDFSTKIPQWKFRQTLF